jgi:hypothetical protein
MGYNTNMKKILMTERRYQQDFKCPNTLGDMKAQLDSYIAEYGPDAILHVEGEYYDDYGSCSTDTLDAFIVFQRPETDAEHTSRLAKEAKARIAAEKRRMTMAEKNSKKKEIQEEKERALLEQLKKKYEVSPDESK